MAHEIQILWNPIFSLLPFIAGMLFWTKITDYLVGGLIYAALSVLCIYVGATSFSSTWWFFAMINDESSSSSLDLLSALFAYVDGWAFMLIYNLLLKHFTPTKQDDSQKPVDEG